MLEVPVRDSETFMSVANLKEARLFIGDWLKLTLNNATCRE
jgi:hypothetical protein